MKSWHQSPHETKSSAAVTARSHSIAPYSRLRCRRWLWVHSRLITQTFFGGRIKILACFSCWEGWWGNPPGVFFVSFAFEATFFFCRLREIEATFFFFVNFESLKLIFFMNFGFGAIFFLVYFEFEDTSLIFFVHTLRHQAGQPTVYFCYHTSKRTHTHPSIGTT